MKVIQIIQKPQLRGAEIFATQLSEHLLALGHVCKIVTLFRGDATLSFSGEIIHLNRPLNWRYWDWMGWKKLAEIVETERPDIIQANAGDTLKFAVLSKQIFGWGSPIVFRNASTISSYMKFPWVFWFNRFLFRYIASVISVSQFTANDFVSLFPFMKNKVNVIPIGIELREDDSALSESGYLLHVGGFTFEKNHEGLLMIISRLLDKHPYMVLRLIGDGPLRPLIERRVVALGLQNNVRFLGYQEEEEVFTYMKFARAVLLPSIIEGLPGVILEAMYCRTPVVAYDVGGISEVVKNGVTGWLVNKGNEEEFTLAIERVFNEFNLDVIKESAYNKVVTEFDNRVIAKRFLSCYQAIVNT